jgi:hypothetical protein
MSEPTLSTEPVNPLVGDLATIAVARRSGPPVETEDVQGRIVKPGLAITPARADKQLPGRPRFSLTHVPTGLAVEMQLCGKHVQDAANLAAASPVDWTATDRHAVVADVKSTDLLQQLRSIAPCSDGYCDGDGPAPPSYGVRCNTCDWEWEEWDNEGPLSFEDAQRQAGDHECDPEVQIMSPITGKWHADWAVKKAEDEAAATQGGAQ